MKKRLSEREGGQLLILPPEAESVSGEDGALSIRTPGSSLYHKGMKSLMRNHSPTLEKRVLLPFRHPTSAGGVYLSKQWLAKPCATGYLALQSYRRPHQGKRSSVPPSLPGRSPPVAGCAPSRSWAMVAKAASYLSVLRRGRTNCGCSSVVGSSLSCANFTRR